jgi:NADPH-dependent glutamate synthase beta subunit-like oxidoreductase
LLIKPIYENKKAPCFSQDTEGQAGCPALNDIPGFLYAISQKKFLLAFEILKKTNPFSGGCGRFCDHPCEYSCNRGKFDSPVNIKDLERFVSDIAFEQKLLPEKITKTIHKSAAIIGSGPSGLTCAYFLKQHGFEVDVFEQENLPGGMMAQGIPVFRYPTEILEWEVAYIKALGVNIHTGKKICTNEIIELGKKYDYLVIATGVNKSRKLGIDGENNSSVIVGIEFLKKLNLNEHFRSSNGDTSHVTDLDIGETVAVIGGGYTSIDVARTASRLGKKVTIYYRRSEKDMDIHAGEVYQCQKEGIEFQFYHNPYEIKSEKNSDGTTTIMFEHMLPGEPGPEGKTSILSSGEFIEVRVHTIIKAIGETPNLKLIPGDFSINNNTIQSENINSAVYITGDARFGYARDVGMVVKAIGSGRNTASDIIENATREKLVWYNEKKIAYYDTIKKRYFKNEARVRSNMLKPVHSQKTFNEVVLPLNQHEAVYAASRCFFCGICIQCDWCYYYSHGSIAKIKTTWDGSRDKPYFKFIDDKVNINTSESVESCPRNAMGFIDNKG